MCQVFLLQNATFIANCDSTVYFRRFKSPNGPSVYVDLANAVANFDFNIISTL